MSTTQDLALLGGIPVRTMPYAHHVTTGAEELKAVQRVLSKGILSDYEGTDNDKFLGGPEVRALEEEWAREYGVPYAMAVNSATSGLMAAVGATGVGPGDEVIVSPFTMSASVAAVLLYNTVPVFADVELDSFNLDPQSVEAAVTPRTKAILITHIFGHPADMGSLVDIARRHSLTLIEDAAQSPQALYQGQRAGTIGDLGVYSLNCNKHIQTGEGGIVVCRDPELAKRVRLIRNHAEAVIASGMEVESLVNMLGLNVRMTELEASLARCQLSKLDGLMEERHNLVRHLDGIVESIDGISPPKVQPECTHDYYRYAISLDTAKLGVNAQQVVDALNAEGMDFYVSYMKPLYLQPIFQKQIVFGDRGCPVRCPWYEGEANYSLGICPSAERLEEFLITTEIVRPPQTVEDMDEIGEALRKVLARADQLASGAGSRS